MTNTGNAAVAAADISVTDDILGPIAGPPTGDANNNGLLDPGETWTYTATGVATVVNQGDPGAVPGRCLTGDPNSTFVYGNIGEVTITTTAGPIVIDDPSHYCTADFSFEKHTNGFDADDANGVLPTIKTGDPVTWTYRVTNDGNSSVSGADVVVTDNILGVIAGPASGDTNNNALLDPGETWVYTVTGVATVLTQGDPGAVPGRCEHGDPNSTLVYENFGEVTITINGSTIVLDDPSHYCTADFTFTKKTNGQDADDPNGPKPVITAGDPVTWTYEVTNTGNAAATSADITLTDSVLGDLVLAGVNQAGVSGPTGDANNNGLLDAGETWTYTVTGVATVVNQGDPGAVPGRCQSGAPDSTFVYGNIGEVTITITPAPIVHNDPSHYCTQAEPDIHVEKFTERIGAAPNAVALVVSGEDADTPTGPFITVGGPVRWNYEVTNPGDVPIGNVVLTDDNGTPRTGDDFNPMPVLSGGFNVGDANQDNLLDPGEVWIYTTDPVAVQAGQYMNLATVSGDFMGTPVSDVDPSHYFGTDPQIHLEKTTNGDDADLPVDAVVLDVGDKITWRYRVTNPGNLPLDNVTVDDDRLGTISNFLGGDTNNDGLLDPGEKWRYSFVNQDADDTSNEPNGIYANVGTATGDPMLPDGNTLAPIQDTDPSHYVATPKEGTLIGIDKTTNGEPGDDVETCEDGAVVTVGEAVVWRFEVFITSGPGPVTGVTVSDSRLGNIDAFFVSGDDGDGVLELGETWVYIVNGTAVAGLYTNTGTVDGVDNLGTARTANDDSCYFGADPQIHIEKSTNNRDADLAADAVELDVGQRLVWRYEVTNPGNVPLANLTVVDDRVGVITRFLGGDTNGDGFLDPGERWRYKFVDAADDTSDEPGGVYENIGTATGEGLLPNGNTTPPVSDDDPSHYVAITPTIDLEVTKSANPEEVIAGTNFFYSVTVENLGPDDATGVVILDLLPPRPLPDPPYAGAFAEFPAFDGVGDAAFEIDVPPIPPESERDADQGATFQDYEAPAGVICSYDATVHGVRCEVGDLAVGASVTVTFELTMDAFALDRVWNRAWVYGDQDEPNQDKDDGGLCETTSNTGAWLASPNDPFPQPAGEGCNYTKKNAQPVVHVDLTIDKVDSKDPVAPGEVFDYIIDTTNNGPSGANDIFTTDELPVEVDFVSASNNCVYDAATHTVECDLGAMGPGTSKTRTITVQVKDGVSGTIFNEVSVETRQPNVTETDPTNNEADEPTLVLIGAIGDFVWHDLNSDGVQDAGEPGIDGVTLTLTSAGGDTTDVTGGGGNYLFANLPPGDYTVTVDLTTLPPGFVPTTVTSMDVAIGLGESFFDADFGFVILGSIGDFLWEDANDNGVFDAGEAPIAGATVTLIGPGGPQNKATVTTTTDANGLYLFADLLSGNYEVTAPDVIGALVIGLNNPPGTYTVVENRGAVFPVALDPGENFLDADFGYIPVLATFNLGDFVWLDADTDGVQDAGEAGIGGVQITITNTATSFSFTATTGSDGKYLAPVDPGTYTVVVKVSTGPANHNLTTVGSWKSCHEPLARDLEGRYDWSEKGEGAAAGRRNDDVELGAAGPRGPGGAARS